MDVRTSLHVSVIMAGALLAAVIGVLATLRRGHWLTTLAFSAAFLSMAAFQAGTLGILQASTPEGARNWAVYLARTSALAAWLWLTLSVVLARSDPWSQIRNSGAYLALALVGCIAMSVLGGSPYVVREVVGLGGGARLVLGTMGKIYLMYLVLVMVAVVMNLERMLRNAPGSAQKRLRPMFLAFLVGILSDLLVVSAGLLYNGLMVSWLVASAAPLFVAGVVTALSLARRSLSDLSIPVARPVIYYSSVSLTLAGVFLLTMAVLSKILPILSTGWKQSVSLGFYVLAGGGGLLLTLSPRASRAVKRFIDRNFYANRYDYRREWERVSSAITPTARIEDIGRQIETLVCSVFEAERAAVYLRRDPGGAFHALHGPPGMPATLEAENALIKALDRTRVPLVFDQVADDLDLIPAVAENRDAIQAMSAALAAPLQVGELLVGVLWVSHKRADEEFSLEDVEFLGAMSRHLASALWFSRQAEQLAETRQLESLHRLSSYVLHDIKNQVSGLSLVVENARRHLANPDFQKDAMAVVERTVSNLRELMSQVSGVAQAPEARLEDCRVADLLDEAAAASGLAGVDDEIQVSLRCAVPDPMPLDRRLILRVLVNLLTNAREAISGPGRVSVVAGIEGERSGTRALVITVTDSGRGMTEEFIRNSLFRPFVTTKKGGLGVGLAQCKAILEAHGGTILVTSKPGQGTACRLRIPVVEPPVGADSPGDDERSGTEAEVARVASEGRR